MFSKLFKNLKIQIKEEIKENRLRDFRIEIHTWMSYDDGIDVLSNEIQIIDSVKGMIHWDLYPVENEKLAISEKQAIVKHLSKYYHNVTCTDYIKYA